MQFDKLYKTTSTGKTSVWWVSVKDDDGKASITTCCGYVDGKLRESTKIITKGKGIGTKRETTPLEQAIKDAQSQWNRKKDRCGMRLDIIQTETKQCIYRPMLAKNYKHDGKKITYPCYVQRKYDGIRYIFDVQNNVAYSRQGKIIKFPVLEDKMKDIIRFVGTKKIYFDGEIYNHAANFSQIQGNVASNILSDMTYYIYDCFDIENKEWQYDLRLQFLKTIKFAQGIQLVDTYSVDNEEQVYTYFHQFLAEKYEGIMLRNIKSIYKINFRSSDLQKLKQMEDAEFKIIDSKEGTGAHKGCIIFNCYVSDDKNFWVTMIGPLEVRQEMFLNKDKYLGKLLTVSFQEYSQYGIPRFPIGKTIRDSNL